MGKRKRNNKSDCHGLPLDDSDPAVKKQKTKATEVVARNHTLLLSDTTPFLDEPTGIDLKREVELYSVLSSEDTEYRLGAANVIISGLLGGKGVSESTLRRHLERRLFRGLASGRKAARLGFSLVLTEILAQIFGESAVEEKPYPGLDFETVFGFLVAKTKPEGDLSGQEEKDHALGMLFGLQSFVRAKIIRGDDHRWKMVLDKLLELSEKKPWIREECGWVIVEAVRQLKKEQAEMTLAVIQSAGLGLSPEGVGIWLTARSCFPQMKFPNKPWGQNGNPLENLKSLAQALKESSSGKETEKGKQANQTGNWNPQLHFVWDTVLGEYRKAIAKEGNAMDFQNFWKVAVDENLFASTASNERKSWGFSLFKRVVKDCDSYATMLPAIFSHNLMRCLINHSRTSDRYLHTAAQNSLLAIVNAAQASPGHVSVFLSQLLDNHGSYDFDKITTSKTVDKLLEGIISNTQNADTNHVIFEKTWSTLRELLIGPTISAKRLDKKTIKAHFILFCNYMLLIIEKSHNTQGGAQWAQRKALQILFDVCYNESLTESLSLQLSFQAASRERLMSAFSIILEDLRDYRYPCDLLLQSNGSFDAVEMDQGVRKELDRALAVLKKLVKTIVKTENMDVKGTKIPALQALALLFGLVIIQLLNGEPDAVIILEDLHLCYESLIKHKSTDDTQASEVLVELLLSFSSRPSALFRKVTLLVFRPFAAEIDEGALKLFTDVLSKSESLEGQQELFDEEPEGMDVSNQDAEHADGLDLDVEVEGELAGKGKTNGHINEDNEEDDSDDEEYESGNASDQDDERAEALNIALGKALGTARPDDAKEEQGSDSDADMTDSEMLELDSKIVEIFKETKYQSKKKHVRKDAKQTVINFKHRVLDLLGIYIRKQAGSPLSYNVLLPLLQLVRATRDKPSVSKANELMAAFVKTAKKPSAYVTAIPDTETFVARQIKLLKAVHEEAAHAVTNASLRASSTISSIVASSIYRADNDAIQKIAKVYHKSELKWLLGGSGLTARLFTDWVNWCQSHVNVDRTTRKHGGIN